LSGLLTAAQRVGEELRYGERNRNSTRYGSAIFLSSDIFDQIIVAAEEPDKISHTRLSGVNYFFPSVLMIVAGHSTELE
jgi:hypothetical protein